MRRLLRAFSTMAVLCSLAACGDGSGDETTQATELQEFSDHAAEVAEPFWGSWPDDAIIDRFADDIAFYDPSDGDFTITGKDTFGAILNGLHRAWADADPSVEAGFAADQIDRYEIWHEDSTLEMLGMGRFASDACPEARALADRPLHQGVEFGRS